MTLTPVEQNELLEKITITLIEAAPPDWQRLIFDFMVMGRQASAGLGVALDNGVRQQVPAPRDVSQPLARLRRGMYVDGLGTWYSMDLVIDRPSIFHARFNHDTEPPFRTPPAPEQYLLDQERYPRTPGNMPDWFRSRYAAAQG
ncbi:hypothetical protein [Virgisporangium aurantiacum]|uniref:Uncharacterized protein n=1 Tax=Virgisporangium aurantiacum TaxID=175570 RepID=A0A8J4E3P8_9ACTN|nr:hypothetical protein [Virgisporangium aurantiacum]GIJ61105.1 hypothetical protein Vau01_086210 [Virgisporangium aurantiacum]